MRSGPTTAVVLEQTRMVMPWGLRSPARNRRPHSAEPKARRGIRNQASSRAPPFHPVAGCVRRPCRRRTWSPIRGLSPVSPCYRAKNRGEACARRVRFGQERDVFPMGCDTTDAEKPVVESKNNRGDCSPVPRGNRAGRAGTGERWTMRRPACNLGASSIRRRVRPESVAPWI